MIIILQIEGITRHAKLMNFSVNLLHTVETGEGYAIGDWNVSSSSDINQGVLQKLLKGPLVNFLSSIVHLMETAI